MRTRLVPISQPVLKRIVAVALLFVCSALLFGVQPLRAATFVVSSNGNQGGTPPNNCDDAEDNCTLRQAIALANENPGPDEITILLEGTEEERTILIPEGGTDEDRNTSDDLDITSSVSIVNASEQRVFIDGNENSRVIHIIGAGETDVSIDGGQAGLMIMNGFAEEGANIYATNATVTISNVTLIGGRAERAGGGLFNDRGVMTVNNSMIAENESELFGAGFFNREAESAFNNVTFYENRAFNAGGGIYLDRGVVILSSSSIMTNRASNGNGGGIQAASGEFFIQDSLFGDAIAGGNCAVINGDITDLGFNMSDDTTCGFQDTLGEGIGDGIDPQVSEEGLKDLGGPILTVSILTTSPAIDKANPEGCIGITAAGDEFDIVEDQRGFERRSEQGDRCDIGAFEVQVPILSVEDVEIAEGDGLFTTFEISIFRSGRADNPVEVTYEISQVGGTANPADDEDFYLAEVPMGGTLAWEPEEGAARTFTVNIAADKDVEPDESFVVNLVVANGGLISLDANSGEVVILDDDAPGFIFEPLEINMVTGGTPTDFSVRLNSRPQAPVAVAFVTNDDSLCTVASETLTIQPENWSDRNAVKLVPDQENSGLCKVTIASVQSEDNLYNEATIDEAINANVFGPDEPALVVSYPSISLVSSQDATASYSLALSAEPSDEVTIELAVSNEFCRVDPSRVTFDDSNFREAQMIEVTPLGETGERCIIRHAVRGAGYDDVDAPAVTVDLVAPYIIERDLSPTPTPTVTPLPTNTPEPTVMPSATPTDSPGIPARVIETVSGIPVWLPAMVVVLIFASVGIGYFLWYKRRYFDPNPPAETIERPEPSPSGFDSGLVGFGGSGVYEKPDPVTGSGTWVRTESGTLKRPSGLTPARAEDSAPVTGPAPAPKPSANISPPSTQDEDVGPKRPSGFTAKPKPTQASGLFQFPVEPEEEPEAGPRKTPIGSGIFQRPTFEDERPPRRPEPEPAPEPKPKSKTGSGLIGTPIDLDAQADLDDQMLDSGLFVPPEGLSRPPRRRKTGPLPPPKEPTSRPSESSIPDDIPDFDPDAYRQDVENQTTGNAPAGGVGMPDDIPDFNPDAYRQDVENQTTGNAPAGGVGMPDNIPDFNPDAYRQDVENQTTGNAPAGGVGMPDDIPDFDPGAYRQDVENQTTGNAPAGGVGMPTDIPDFDPGAYRRDVDNQTSGNFGASSSGSADESDFGSFSANPAQDPNKKKDEDEEDDFYGF